METYLLRVRSNRTGRFVEFARTRAKSFERARAKFRHNYGGRLQGRTWKVFKVGPPPPVARP